MARNTLKLGKRPATTTPKTPSSRAIRAQPKNVWHKASPTGVAGPVPSAAPSADDVAASPGRGVPGAEGRREPAPAGAPKPRGNTIAAQGAPSRPAAAKRGKPGGARKGKPASRGPQVASKDASPARGPAHRLRTGAGAPRAADPVNPAPARRRDVARLDPSLAPHHENSDDPRLSKRMSELGLCSRREADEWIENGWVKVDGKVVDVLGVRVSRLARIEVARAAAQHQGRLVTILLNKPIGYVSGQAEEGHTPASVLLTPENRWAGDPSGIVFVPAHLRGLAPAGRLDIDSTGLIVFTQDGRVAKRLIGSDSEVEKEYLVRVKGRLDDAGMRLLRHGLELDGVKLRPARVSWQNEDQLRFVLREGRKRQIRRMCELVGLVVTGLKRVRSGSVSLGPLPLGQWRYLRRDEKF